MKLSVGMLGACLGFAGAFPAEARPFDSRRAEALAGRLPGFDAPAVRDPRERVAGLVELLAQEIADPSDPTPWGMCGDGPITSTLRQASIVRILGTSQICPPDLVRQALVDTGEPVLRRYLSIAVTMAGGTDTAEAAAWTAVNDPDPWLRQVAVRALASLRQPRLAPIFLQALSDPYRTTRGIPVVAQTARMALAKLGLSVRYEKPCYRVADRRGKLLYVVNERTRVVQRAGPEVASANVPKLGKPAPAKRK